MNRKRIILQKETSGNGWPSIPKTLTYYYLQIRVYYRNCFGKMENNWIPVQKICIDEIEDLNILKNIEQNLISNYESTRAIKLQKRKILKKNFCLTI